MRLSRAYYDYMSSAAWREKRLLALERAGNRCQVCGRNWGLQVHHITYDNFGNEGTFDLSVLCFECHAVVTTMLRVRRWWRGVFRFLRRWFNA